MEAFIAQLFESAALFSYPLVFALLIAGGMGAPVSEELVLLAGGMVAAEGRGNLPLLMAVGYLGALGGDALLFRLGRKLGPRALTNRHLKRVLTPNRVLWIESHFAQHSGKTLFLARFIPGIRAGAFLIAGVSRLPWKRFLFADGAAALISAPLLTYLGFRFGTLALAEVRHYSRYLALGVIAVVLVSVLFKLSRRKKRVETGEADVAADMAVDWAAENRKNYKVAS